MVAVNSFLLPATRLRARGPSTIILTAPDRRLSGSGTIFKNSRSFVMLSVPLGGIAVG